MGTRILRDGKNEEEKVIASSPVRPSGLSEVQLVNMGKGMARTWKGLGSGGRKHKRGKRPPRFDRSNDE